MEIQFSPLMLVTASIIGIISAILASKRNKNPYLWFVLGFLFGVFGIFAIVFASSPKKKSLQQVPKQPAFRIDGPIDKFWYYLDPAHQQQGPMSQDALIKAWKSGKINLSTFIWHEELPEWKPLKETLRVDSP